MLEQRAFQKPATSSEQTLRTLAQRALRRADALERSNELLSKELGQQRHTIATLEADIEEKDELIKSLKSRLRELGV